jgi:hypothetical protein
MSKILQHKDKEKIDRIILEHKFKGLGSNLIQQTLLNKLAFNISRPSIDSYYEKHLNGAMMTELIAKTKKSAILSVSGNGESSPDEVKPSYNQDIAQKVYTFVEDWQNSKGNWADKPETNEAFMAYSEVYASAVALMVGNMQAHVNGRERLKAEYVRYVKELKGIMRGNY